MAGELFEDVVEPSISVGTKQWYTVPLSILAHAAGLAGLVVIPLVAAGMLPTPESVLVFAATPPSPPPEPPPVTIRAPAVTPMTPANPNLAPPEAPSQVVAEPPPQIVPPIHGVPGGIPDSLQPANLRLAPPPEAPPLFVRPGGAIKDPRKIHDAAPVYPPIAIAAKSQGVVIIEAIINKEGDVVDARVLRSQPLLDQAALDAVRQWKFTPTLLNGIPVEVHMTVSVNFTLH
jgi:protein TonB